MLKITNNVEPRVGAGRISIFFTFSQPGPSFINLFLDYSQSDLPPLRQLCEARDSNLGRADLVAGTLNTRPPHRFSKAWSRTKIEPEENSVQNFSFSSKVAPEPV